ncbi:DUF5677 domain-containing protein [Telluribacter humicola]|uniref:DUF5677 domain-containing protein n=1 Tax=Telluribacter humicola TaxID=1720261 RepID=UPI001A971200|nr:DUF5677 domain-containing protein [Telluribacter humicola]
MYKAIPEILPREISDEQQHKILQVFSNTLEEFVNFGTHILDWDLNHARGGDEQLPPMLLFRNFLELIDSISILIKNSSIDPSKIILRTALETSFGLEYMLRENTEDRSMAFLVCQIHKEIKDLKKHDPNSEVGKRFRLIFKKDVNTKGVNLPTPDDLEYKIKYKEDLLLTPKYIKAENEYQILYKNKERNPNWYRLFSGPSDVERLCDTLEIPTLYEVFYRNLSNSIHGNDILHGKIVEGANGKCEIYQIRFPKEAQSVTSTSIVISMRTFDYYIQKRAPQLNNNFIEWRKTVQNRLEYICGHEQIMIIE